MSCNFGTSPSSLSGLEEDRVCRFEAEQRGDEKISFPKCADVYVSSMMPSEFQFSPWAMSYRDTEDDCVSGALYTSSSAQPRSPRPILGDHFTVKSSRHRQLFADRVQTSVHNLQVLHDKISSMVAVETDDSEGLPQGEEGSWHWMSQGTQECVTAESLDSRVEEGESKYTGGKRSASTVEIEDLLSSLQTLLSILKNHEESEQILRAKTQLLRERKQALHDEKQQYKRQRGSKCWSSLSQDDVHLWLAERD